MVTQLNQSPIVLFAYNRPAHTRATVEALVANRGASESDLFVFSDGPRDDAQVAKVAEVRHYLRGVKGFKSITIVEQEANQGLAKSVISGVSSVLDSNPACIVVEDDLVTTPTFLPFMNAALRTYEQRRDVFSVTGYNYPLAVPASYPHSGYLSRRASSWGWGTWRDRWQKVDWSVSDYETFVTSPKEQALFARGGDDLAQMLEAQMKGRIDSWAIRFCYAHYKHNAFCLHATQSKLQNIGFDGSGVHCGVSDDYQVALDYDEPDLSLPADLAPDPDMLRIFAERFKRNTAAAPPPRSILQRIAGTACTLARTALWHR